MSYSAKHWTLFLLWPERRCFTSKLSVGIWSLEVCVIYCELEDRQCLTELLTTQVWSTTRVGREPYLIGTTPQDPGDKSQETRVFLRIKQFTVIVLSVLSFIYCSQGFQNLSLNQIFFHFKTEISTIKISWFLLALKIISTREKAHTALTVAALTRDFSMAAGSIGRDDVGIPSDCQQSSLHNMASVAIRVRFNWDYWEELIMVRTQAEAVSREDRPDGESRRHQDQGCALDLAVRQGLKQTRHVKHFRCSTQLSQSSLRTGDVWKIPIWKPHGSNCSTEISC